MKDLHWASVVAAWLAGGALAAAYFLDVEWVAAFGLAAITIALLALRD